MSDSKLSFISENGAKSRVTFGNMIFALILIEIAWNKYDIFDVKVTHKFETFRIRKLKSRAGFEGYMEWWTVIW